MCAHLNDLRPPSWPADLQGAPKLSHSQGEAAGRFAAFQAPTPWGSPRGSLSLPCLHQPLRRCLPVQGVSFLGRDDEFVMSGSDCGHIYVWERDSGVVQAVLKVRQEQGSRSAWKEENQAGRMVLPCPKPQPMCVRGLQGDADTVNCLEPHPQHLLTMATSGIEDSIKLWAPTAEEPQVKRGAARRGGVTVVGKGCCCSNGVCDLLPRGRRHCRVSA